MKFKLTMVKCFFHKKYDKLKFDAIKDLNFKIDNKQNHKDVLYYNGDPLDIELETLDELIEFVKKHGQCMISTRLDNDKVEITIVNDHMC